MDKYQSYVMKTYKPSLYGKCFSPQGDIHSFKVVFDDSYTITLCQHENITFSNYSLYIECKSTIVESVYGIRGTEQVVSRLEERQVRSGWQTTVLPIDFSAPFDSLRIVFKNNLVDDIIMPIIYQAADKEAYYARIEQERAAELLKNANIKVSTGSDLVNIYFQPCSEDYSRTEIVLYKDNMQLAQYKVDEEVFFKPIRDLAYGKYAFILKQYNEKGAVLLKTDKIFFELSAPVMPHIPCNIVN